MKAIIIAAGKGTRLKPLTNDCPKSMLPVDGKSILQRSIDTLLRNGVSKIAVVRGHCADKINVEGPVEYYENMEFEINNILHSLFCAKDFIEDEIIISYSDIIFTDEVVVATKKFNGEIGVVVDKNFQQIYEGRDEHPLSEAELALSNDGSVILIGKKSVSTHDATGEFIGLVKLSASGAEIFKKEYEKLINKLKMDDDFHRAKRFSNAYITDFLQELIEQGFNVEPIYIHGGWMEIDTLQDYHRAQRFYEGKL